MTNVFDLSVFDSNWRPNMFPFINSVFKKYYSREVSFPSPTVFKVVESLIFSASLGVRSNYLLINVEQWHRIEQ